ncbi:hypothetical protein pb186bvf_002540 [Paramecium bursaria]
MEFTLVNIQEYIKKVMQEKEDQLSKGKLKRVQELTQNQQMALYDIDVQMQLEEFEQAWDELYKLKQDRVS